MKRLLLLILLCSAAPAIAYPENDATFLYSTPRTETVNFNPATGNTFVRGANDTYINASTGEEYNNYIPGTVQTDFGKTYTQIDNSGYYRVD